MSWTKTLVGFVGLGALMLGCAGAEGPDASSASADEALGASKSFTFTFAPGFERQHQHLAGAAGVADAQHASVHMGNAYWLERLSQASYNEAPTLAPALAAIGFPAIESRVFSNHCTGAAAIYVRAAGFAVVAFRGTEPQTWLDDGADALSFKVGWQGPGVVHAGFLLQFESLWSAQPSCGVPEGLGSFLTARPGGELYMTGFSLGAALATLAVARTYTDACGATPGCTKAPEIPVSALYAFGSPKVGDTTFAQVVSDRTRGRTPIYRFVFHDDIVTGLPRNLDPLELTVFRHLGYSGEAEDIFQVWMDDRDVSISSFVLHVTWDPRDHDFPPYLGALAVHAKAWGELH